MPQLMKTIGGFTTDGFLQVRPLHIFESDVADALVDISDVVAPCRGS